MACDLACQTKIIICGGGAAESIRVTTLMTDMLSARGQLKEEDAAEVIDCMNQMEAIGKKMVAYVQAKMPGQLPKDATGS